MPCYQSGLNNSMRVDRDYNDVAGNQTNLFFNVAQEGSTHSKMLSELRKKLDPFETRGAGQQKCLIGTRKDTRKKISDWIHDTKSGRPNVAFLLGSAGKGKSTIALTIAGEYRGCLLGCDLFFHRGDNTPDTLIRTLAYNLARKNEHIARAISSAVENLPESLSAPHDELFDILLQKPLSSVASKIDAPILIVIDALDEYHTPDFREALLRVFSKKLTTLPSRIRFLITGRPEIDIRLFVSSSNVYEIDLDKSPNENFKDVCAYIKHELKAMKESEQLLLPDNWPWKENMKKLGEAADGLFIWASTAVKFIKERKQNGAGFLDVLIHNKTLNLDALYETILEDSLYWDNSMDTIFPNVFSIIFFCRKSLTDMDIDRILSLKEGTTKSILLRLRSLVLFEAGRKIRVHHASFYDYLISRACINKRWYVDIARQKEIIVRKCLERMIESLHFNICNLESSFLLNECVPDLQKRIKDNIPTHLQYICCNWAHHLRETSYTQELGGLLRIFVYNKLLFWFEVLSLTETFDDYVGVALMYAILWLKGEDPGLSAFLREAERQTIVFSEPISESVPHIYSSLLPLTRDESFLSKHYSAYANPGIQVMYSRNKKRDNCIKIMDDHDNGIFSVLFSPDGTQVLSTSLDDVVRLWDATSGDLKSYLRYAADKVAFSPTGDLIALAFSEDEDKEGEEEIRKGEIVVWNPARSGILKKLLTNDTGSVTSVVFSKSGEYIASGYRNGRILIWNVETGMVERRALESHTEDVNSVSFSYGDQYLVSGSSDGTVVLWDVERRTMKYAPLRDYAGRVDTVAFSPTAEYIVSGSSNKTFCIWETSTGKMVRRYEGCSKLVCSADGLEILGYEHDGTIKMYKMSDDYLSCYFRGSFKITEDCASVAISPHNTRIVSGHADQKVKIWDVIAGLSGTGITQEHKAAAYAVAVSQTGRYVASGDGRGVVSVWNSASGELVSGPWKGHRMAVIAIAFSADERLIASGSDDGTIRVWKVSSGESFTIRVSGLGVSSVAFSPNGKHIASGSSVLRVWSVENRELDFTPFKGSGGVNSVAYSPDGSKIVSGSRDGTVRIWNATNGDLLSTLTGHSEPVCSVAYSPNGRYIISGSHDMTLRLWDVNTRETVFVMPHHDIVHSVSFSPDGTRILSRSGDDKFYVWRTSTGDFFRDKIQVYTEWVASTTCSFLPDGDRFVYGSNDGTIRIRSLVDTTNWVIDCESGWIVDNNRNLLMWLPKGLHETLITSGETVLMNVLHETRLELSPYLTGNEWSRPLRSTSN